MTGLRTYPKLGFVHFCTIASLLALTNAQAQQSRPAEFSGPELQQRLAETNARVGGYHIIYDSFNTTGATQPAGTYVHREIASFKPGFFYHSSAKGTARYTPDEDPLRQSLLVNDQHVVIEYPGDRAFVESKWTANARLPGSAPRELLFLTIGWWPLQTVKSPVNVPGTAVVLPDVAQSDQYHVLPEQQLVAGRWCHVLEHAGHDRLWLDVARGCAIIAREIIDAKSRTVRQRIEGVEFREVAPEIWAPIRFRNLVFNQTNHRLQVDAEAIIRRIEVNGEPPLHLFSHELQPGSIELRNGGYLQRVGGGLDHLDVTVAQLKRLEEAHPVQSASALNTSVFGSSTAWGLIGIAVAVIGIKYKFGCSLVRAIIPSTVEPSGVRN